MIENYESLPRMIGALLRIPFQATVERVYQRLSEAGYHDLRPTHFALFQQLRPEGLHMTELARLSQMTKQSMSELVYYLEERGYIERSHDPHDGRAWLVRLTDRGREVERIARGAIGELEIEWAQYLGKERFASLQNALRDLVAFIEHPEEIP